MQIVVSRVYVQNQKEIQFYWLGVEMALFVSMTEDCLRLSGKKIPGALQFERLWAGMSYLLKKVHI